jgi:hypothetical protein
MNTSSSSDDIIAVAGPSTSKTPSKTPSKSAKRPLFVETPGSAPKRARIQGTKSKIWEFFDRSDDKMVLTCRLCKKECRTKHSSTGPMHSHMKVHHPGEMADFLLAEAKDEQTKVSRNNS